MSAQNVSIKGTMPGDKNDRRSFVLKADREYGRFKQDSTYDILILSTTSQTTTRLCIMV